MQKQVLHNQSLLDFTLHHSGALSGLLKLVIANGVSITDEIVSGTELTISTDVDTDADILQFYTNKGVKPAFGNTKHELVISDKGIGTMTIGTTFIVGS